MKSDLEKLEKVFGSRIKAAKAIGYSERRYRDFLTGRAPIPKSVELAIDRLLTRESTQQPEA